jgi:hypothetical protein
MWIVSINFKTIQRKNYEKQKLKTSKIYLKILLVRQLRVI